MVQQLTLGLQYSNETPWFMHAEHYTTNSYACRYHRYKESIPIRNFLYIYGRKVGRKYGSR